MYITREERILDSLPEKEKDGWSAPDVYWTEALRQYMSQKKTTMITNPNLREERRGGRRPRKWYHRFENAPPRSF